MKNPLHVAPKKQEEAKGRDGGPLSPCMMSEQPQTTQPEAQEPAGSGAAPVQDAAAAAGEALEAALTEKASAVQVRRTEVPGRWQRPGRLS